MDKMCNKSGTEDLNKTITNAGETDNLKNRGSPVFKCFNHTKAGKANHLDSSDYDIPSYQLSQSVKSRTSSKYGNETSESVLPFTPIFSPIPVVSSVQFQPPSIHSLSTVVKNVDRTSQNKVNSSFNFGKTQSVKSCGVFESLGMTDKDISWVSSMATPPPKNVPGSEFNTVEKATFFPEEKFQNIQPRALFSPTLDDDFGCHPIVFTSESDDDEYKSNIRLSDVCATLKQLEVKSLDLVQNHSTNTEYNISPIIKTKKKKLEIVKKKKKGSLVISPENKEKYEFEIGGTLKSVECEKVRSNSGTNFIEDDSFQSMSFSGIDELCKTLVSEQSNTSATLKTGDCDKTLVNAKDNIELKSKNTLKKFYSTKANDVFMVSSMDNLYSYAKALEESDKCNSVGSKINQPLPQTGIVRVDALNKDTSKLDGAKRSYSEVTEGNDQNEEKKFKKVEEENSGWENVKQYLSESQLNISDGEIFRTVENLEKTLASQESKDLEKSHAEALQGALASHEGKDLEILNAEELQNLEAVSSQNSNPVKACTDTTGKNKEDTNYSTPKCTHDAVENCKAKNNDTKSSDSWPPTMPFLAFATAAGSKISVSETALSKARKILKECDESLDFDKKALTGNLDRSDVQTEVPKPGEQNLNYSQDVLMKGFSTGSGKQIKISAEALKKAKALMAECEVPDDMPEKSVNQKKLTEKSGECLTSGFSTGSGKQIQISNEALEKANSLMLDLDDDTRQHFQGLKLGMDSFSTGSGRKIQVSAKALEKAKALMAECDKGEEDSWLKRSEINSKETKCEKNSRAQYREPSTSSATSAKPNQISLKTLQKEKSSFEDSNEKQKDNINIPRGFSTGSGKTIQISADALNKAKLLMQSCERELNESSDKLAAEWLGELPNKTSCAMDEINGKSFSHKMGEPCTKVCFSTASGNEVKVSTKALEKAKELWSVDKTTEMPGSSTVSASHLMGFVTAGGSKVTISESALARAKERMNELDQIKPEDLGNFESVTDSIKTSVKNTSEIPAKTTKLEDNNNKISTTSVMNESDDWDAIIPSWLHVYSTSPSMISERMELSPVTCHEDGESSKPEREYIVRSPVLGTGDRFHGKKKRKLRFEDDRKSHEKIGSGFVVPYKNPERKTSVKRTSNLNLDFSAPFKKIKIVEENVVDECDIKSERERAREEQERTIKGKQKVKPLVGSHLHRKCSEKQMSWREAVAGSSPEVHSDEFLRKFGISEDILHINIQNAVSHRFKGEDFFGPSCTKNIKGIPVGDGCSLILDDDNEFGVEELKSAFLASPGVQTNLVPQGWVENHYKWIIWKLVHYERSFPQYFGGRCMTPNQILLQLKYRYDREIDRNERSALKKILERDDTSIKRLVLCVHDIQKVIGGETVGYKLKLTDGWYSCPALSDPAMTRLVEEGKVCVGTKLLTQGATLINCEQGVSPLEINGDVYLKISTNSTRRIRWDAKLGFQKNPENFPISLGSILPQGGPISRIDVIIVRIYPTLFMEKTSDGHHVTRNRRAEEKADSEYRRIQEKRMETISNEVQSEMRKSANLHKKTNRKCLDNFEQVEDLSQLMESSSDPSALEELMTADQRKLLEKLQSNQNDRFSRELMEKIEKKLEKEKLNKRNVTEFLRVKIVDFRKPDFNNPAILSVWNPNEDLTALLSEGKVFSLMNVTISNSSRLYKPLQINTTRQTQYRQIVRNVKYPARKLTRLKDVSSKVCPAFEEVDIVGIVALIRDVSYGSRLSQVIYLTDLEMNFVGIVFWGSCKDYGWENVLRIPSVVACSNLQWKKNYTPQDVPSLYFNENSVFTENPKHAHLKEEIERLKQSMPQDKTSFLSKCEENLTTKLEDSKWQTNSSKNSSANDSNLKETAQPRIVNGFESKPAASSTPIKPFSMRMGSDEGEPSPIQKRIEKLQCYGEPPSLIPLLVRNNARRKSRKKT